MWPRVSQLFSAVLLLMPILCFAQGFVAGPRSVAIFRSADDQRCHVVVALQSGAIVDVSHDCHGNSIAVTSLAALVEPMSVSAFYADYNKLRHVVAIQRNGDLYDIRYRFDIPPAPIRLLNVIQLGAPISLSAWIDNKNNRNIALLSSMNGSLIVSVYQALIGRPGAINVVQSFPGQQGIDLQGAYSAYDNTNQLQVAAGTGNAGSHLQFLTWKPDKVPDSSNIKSNYAASNTPWVTNFPGASSSIERILSLAASPGFPTSYQPWSTELVTLFLDATNGIRTFSANNGGGQIAGAPITSPGVTPLSISNPLFLLLPNDPAALMEFGVSASDGRLFLVWAFAPTGSQTAPSWTWVPLASF